MKINELEPQSNDKNGAASLTNRRTEVQRLARSLAAERAASAQAVHNSSGAGSQNDLDTTTLSTEAVKEVTGRNDASQLSRTDQIVDALKASMDNIAEDPNRQKRSSGGSKKKKVKTKQEWTPTASEGELKEGRGVIGRLRITKEVKESPGGSVGKGTANGNTAGSKPADSSGSSGSPQAKNGSKGPSSEGEKESQEGAQIEKNLQSQGLQAQGLTQDRKAGAQGGGDSVKEYDVRTRATGINQRLRVTPAKTMRPGDIFGTFRRLDDKPILNHATLHSRNTEDAANEVKKKARAAGESPDQIQEMLQLLRDKNRPDK